MNKDIRLSRPARRNGSDAQLDNKRSRKDAISPMNNRCCYVTPDYKEFGQLTDLPVIDDTQKTVQHFIIPEHLNPLQNALFNHYNKVDNCSQYNVPQNVPVLETCDDAQWHNVDNVDDIDRYFMQDKQTPRKVISKNIEISESPRVKVIAEKYTKFKNNNIQLRKLEEKVVCVEYDIYSKSDEPITNENRPIQVMRAFFSIKPVGNDNLISEIPSTLKTKFKINNDEKLNDKELEIIDGNIIENQPYLNDIKKILQRNNLKTKKSKNTIDLHSLYDMAKKECLHFDRKGVSAFTKDELMDIKEMILRNCDSNAQGIRRKTVRSESKGSTISASIVAELLM